MENPRPRRGLKLFLSLVIGAGLFLGGLDLGRHQAKQPSAAAPLDYASVDKVYSLLKNDFDGSLDNTKLNDGLKTGLVEAAGDPYTEYFNPKQATDFNQELSGSFTGIGAELGTNSKGEIVVVSPLSGSPAQAAGLKPNDVIAKINGQSTDGISIDEAVSKIRGPSGSQVTLTLIRGNTPSDVTITRSQINVPSVESKVDGNIGYLKINQFGPDTVTLAQKAASDFTTQKVKAVVLDLRGDPGGYLDAAVKVSSLWLNSGQVVVQEKRGNQIISTEYANGNDPLHGLPTVVLIDGGSASASEITAGALHDNQAAQLVGAKSFGKGSVQQVEKLADGSQLKVTVARWYTPKGVNIDKQGIQPDVAVAAGSQSGQDPQKDKAYQLVQSQIH